MQGLTRPKYFMPVHGEYKHMAANRELAVAMGIPHENVFISDIGKVLEIDEKGALWGGTVPAGVVLIDGLGVGDVGNIVLRDRKHLSQDGLIVVVATVDSMSGLRVAGPDIVSRYRLPRLRLRPRVRGAHGGGPQDRRGCHRHQPPPLG